MKRSSVRLGLLIAALAAGLAACASRPEVELRMVLQMETSGADRAAALDQTLRILRRRLDQFGIYDAVVEAAPGDRISVRLPAVEDPERAGRLIRQTGLLEFRRVGFPAGGGGVGSREAILQHYDGQLPPSVEILEGNMQGANGGTQFYGVEARRWVTDGDFLSATASRGQFGEPVIEFQLRPEAARAFGEATGQNVGSGLAIVLDGRVVSAPKISSRITDRGVIQGQFKDQEVQDMTLLLRSGALPARLTVVEEHTGSPSPSAHRRGMTAMLATAAVLLVFFVILGLYAQRRPKARR